MQKFKLSKSRRAYLIKSLMRRKSSTNENIPDDIRLKIINLTNDVKIQKKVQEEIRPILEKLMGIRKRIVSLIIESVNKKILPPEFYVEWAKYKNESAELFGKHENEEFNNLSKLLIHLISNREVIKVITSLKEYNPISKSLQKIIRDLHNSLKKIQKKYRIYISIIADKIFLKPYLPVMLLSPDIDFISESYIKDLSFHMSFLMLASPMVQESIKEPKPIAIETSIDKDCLCLQVDLRYDKKVIMQTFDDIITNAQKLIGKYPVIGKRKDSKSIEKKKLVENLFLDFYVKKGLSKNETLEKIASYLKQEKIQLEPESINRKYIPNIKRKYSVKNVRELRNLKKGDK